MNSLRGTSLSWSHPSVKGQRYLDIGQTLAGVTFLAFANGAPDVLTAIIAGNSDSDSTALIPFGSIFGALMFSTAIILSQVILNSRTEAAAIGLKVNKADAIKPISFYVGSTIAMLLISLFAKQMTWYYASLFLVAYTCYCVLEIRDDRKQKAQKLQMQSDIIVTGQEVPNSKQQKGKKSLMETMEPRQKEEEEPDESVETEYQDKNVVGKIQHVISVVLGFIFFWTIPIFQAKNWHPYKFCLQMILSAALLLESQGVLLTALSNGIPYIALAEAAALLICVLTVIFFRNAPPKYMLPIQLYSFVVIVAWISFICAIIINFMELIMVITDIDSVFIGLTMLACGNSIGDYYSIKAFAQKGKGITAIAGVLSGQLFNLLVGMGCSMLIRTISKGSYQFNLFPKWNDVSDGLEDSIVWIVIVFSIANLTVILIYLFKNRFFLGEKFANYLIIVYVLFVGTTSLLAILSDIFGDITCALKYSFKQT